MNDLTDVQAALGEPEPPSQEAYAGTTTILTARWTNTLPRIIPGSQLASPPRAKG